MRVARRTSPSTEPGTGQVSAVERSRAAERPARDDRFLLMVGVAIAAALILPFALVHLDDADGVVYTVIARHLAQDGRLFDLRFLPELFPHFREHPPFFFWVWALLLRVVSETALPLVGAACGIATVAIAYAVGRELAGTRAAFLGAVALATTESFFRYQARVRLDPPLTLLFSTAIGLVVLARGRVPLLLAAGVAAGLGALVKGPPALGAPIAAALVLVAIGRGRELHRPIAWLAMAIPALALPALFLAYDRVALGATWWHGYVHDQLIASLTGQRHDGASDHLFIVRSTLGRMGPWVVPIAFAVVRAIRSARAPLSRATWALLLWAGVVVGGYSLAGRAWWHYAMPAYVPLALLAGIGLDDVLARVSPRAFPAFRRFLSAAAVILVALLPLRLARFVVQPCSLGRLPSLSAQASADRRVALVSDRVALVEAGILAQHARVESIPVVGPATLDTRHDLSVALVEDRVRIPAGWVQLEQYRHWTLLRRAAPPR